jgi:nicotinic acid mononucleotide adenylyltransferase
MFFTQKKKPLETSSPEQPNHELRIDEVWIVPCGLRPDKPHISKPEIRLEMTKLAVQDFFPKDTPLKIDPIEVQNGPSIPTSYLLD